MTMSQQVSFFSFAMNISGAKFEEHGFNISRDIFFSTVLVQPPMTLSLSLFA